MALETYFMAATSVLKRIVTLDISAQIERVRIDNAVQSLRQIFFFSPELKHALEQIAQGEPINDEIAAFFAESFASVPREIAEALEYLRHERFEDGSRVLIEDMELMSQIGIGKINVRREIGNFFRSYSNSRNNRAERSNVRTEAARIVGQIERFNVAVKECEKKLLRLRNQRPADQGNDRPPPRGTRQNTRKR
jgi:hypothetical protein